MIYILEDDEPIRTMLMYALMKDEENKGFECPSAFWKAMEEKAPQLIILDLMLPEEDGLSVLKKLKASPAWEDISPYSFRKRQRSRQGDRTRSWRRRLSGQTVRDHGTRFPRQSDPAPV